MGEEGVTLVRVLVKADGRAGEVELKRSSGYDRLDQAALRAVRKWRFVPATKHGEPVDAWLDQPVNFKLNS
jgi:protein TonB